MQDWLIPRVQRCRALSTEKISPPGAVDLREMPAAVADTFIAAGLKRRSGGDAWPVVYQHDPNASYLTTSVKPFQHDESYRLTLRSDQATIEFAHDLGAFRGLTTLGQILSRADDLAWRRLPAARIVDWPMLQYRGLMYDLARNNVYRHGHIRELLELAVSLKYTHVTLYLEERFRWPSLPLYADNENFISPEQAGELDDWAGRNFLAIVPQTNCLGHNEGFAGFELFADVSEDRLYGAQLRTGHEQSLRHVAKRYRELTRVFSSPILHVGGDEARELGQRAESAAFGREHGDASQPDGGAKGRGAIYLRHIKAVHRVVQKLGRDMALWGDMIKLHPEIADHIPRDVIIHDWIYRESNRESLKNFARKGYRVIATSTDSGAYHMGPDLERARRNIDALFADAIELELFGGEQSMWEMEQGHNYPLAVYPLLYAGHFMWSGKPVARADFASAMTAHLLGSDTHTFAQLNESLLVDANHSLIKALTDCSARALHDYTDERRYQSWRKDVTSFTAEIPRKQTPFYHLISLITSPAFDIKAFADLKNHVQVALRQLAAIQRTARRNEELLAGYELMCQIHLFNLELLERLPAVEKHYHRAAVAQARRDADWHARLQPLNSLLDDCIERYRALVKLQKQLVKRFGHPQLDVDQMEIHIELTKAFKQKVADLKNTDAPLQNYYRFLLEYPVRHF